MTTATLPKRGLNRGLDSLLSDRAKSLVKGDFQMPERERDSDLKQLPIDKLDRGVYQPRQHFKEENLQELADSIRAQGIIQPIIVRRKTDGRYEIIAGERRSRAAKLAGLETIPAIVRELADKPTLAIALIENIQRQDLNVLEEALALQRLIEEFSLTQEEVATQVGKSRSAVTNILRLLKLAPEVQGLIQKGLLEMGHGRALLSLPTSAQQHKTALHVVEKNLSVRDTERLVQQLLAEPSQTSQSGQRAETDHNIQTLENALAEKLGAKIAIKHTPIGKGKLEIFYHSVDELEGILAHIQ